MKNREIGIIGAGRTGGFLALLAAQAGYTVTLMDAVRGNLEKAVERLKEQATQLEARKVVEDKRLLLENVKLSLSLESLEPSEVVFETIPEEESLKAVLFKELSRILKPHSLLLTSVVSGSVTARSALYQDSKKVLGLHFIPPFEEKRFVEIIPGRLQSAESLMQARDLFHTLGLRHVTSQDYAGFLFNRVFLAAFNEAVYALAEGVGNADEIDRAFEWGSESQMGPLALADLMGLDVVLGALQKLHQERGGTRFLPCPLLTKKVEAGELGRKARKGFFDYSNSVHLL